MGTPLADSLLKWYVATVRRALDPETCAQTRAQICPNTSDPETSAVMQRGMLIWMLNAWKPSGKLGVSWTLQSRANCGVCKVGAHVGNNQLVIVDTQTA